MFTMRARNVIDSSSTYWEMAENFDQLSEVQVRPPIFKNFAYTQLQLETEFSMQ
jgi:hypothetical protein